MYYTEIKDKLSRSAYSNIEIHAVLFLVVGDINRLHPHIGHVNGAREKEKHCQAWEQQANDDRGWHIQLSVKHTHDGD